MRVGPFSGAREISHVFVLKPFGPSLASVTLPFQVLFPGPHLIALALIHMHYQKHRIRRTPEIYKKYSTNAHEGVHEQVAAAIFAHTHTLFCAAVPQRIWIPLRDLSLKVRFLSLSALPS